MGSRNVAGQVLSYSDGNQGHSVKYSGRPASRASSGAPLLSSGLRGTWSIARDHDSGRWQLWPVSGNWAAGEGDGAEEDVSVVTNTASGECRVCYDRAIDVRLIPCMHVALCRTCANTLPTRKCPLCRANIESMRKVRI
jgi:hypothetical protein